MNPLLLKTRFSIFHKSLFACILAFTLLLNFSPPDLMNNSSLALTPDSCTVMLKNDTLLLGLNDTTLVSIHVFLVNDDSIPSTYAFQFDSLCGNHDSIYVN